jgi:hypothetical protein
VSTLPSPKSAACREFSDRTSNVEVIKISFCSSIHMSRLRDVFMGNANLSQEQEANHLDSKMRPLSLAPPSPPPQAIQEDSVNVKMTAITQKTHTEESSPSSETIVISPLRVTTERCLVSRRTRSDRTCEQHGTTEEATAVNMVNAEGFYTRVGTIRKTIADNSLHPCRSSRSRPPAHHLD